jgi:hypothetical protein
MHLRARSIVRFASAASLLGIAGLVSVSSAQTKDFFADRSEAQAQQTWRDTMHKTEAPSNGCFHASYPSTDWQQVDCVASPGYRSALPSHRTNEQVIGNAYDYVAQAPSGHTFSLVAGSFPTVKGVTSEKGANVPFGSGESDGITGKNEYTVQVNTNIVHTAACGSYSYCYAWQQYVISTNTPVSLTSSQLSGKTEVFIEYWLINYGVDNGKDICPSEYLDAGKDAEGPGDDCVQNTPAVVVYNGQLPAVDLASLSLSGSATASGTDKAVATYGGDAYTATVPDSYTDISSEWTQAEFNVFGNAGGSRADFNSGASLTAKVAVTDGSTSAPTCVSPSSDDGTTGETNNLTAKSCSTTSGSAPYITFTESD